MKKLLSLLVITLMFSFTILADGDTGTAGRWEDCPDPTVNCHICPPGQTCDFVNMAPANETSVPVAVYAARGIRAVIRVLL